FRIALRQSRGTEHVAYAAVPDHRNPYSRSRSFGIRAQITQRRQLRTEDLGSRVRIVQRRHRGAESLVIEDLAAFVGENEVEPVGPGLDQPLRLEMEGRPVAGI